VEDPLSHVEVAAVSLTPGAADAAIARLASVEINDRIQVKLAVAEAEALAADPDVRVIGQATNRAHPRAKHWFMAILAI
jgi:hypothetical protein